MRPPASGVFENFPAFATLVSASFVRFFVSVHCPLADKSAIANVTYVIFKMRVHVLEENFVFAEGEMANGALKLFSVKLKRNYPILYIRVHKFFVLILQMVEQCFHCVDAFITNLAFQLSNVELYL